MVDSQLRGRHLFIRTLIIVFCVLVYIGFGVYLQLVVRTNIVYTHFAYIPIVLSGVWWGRRAILVALLFAAVTFSFHIFDIGGWKLWEDVLRVFFFILVAFFIGELSEKVNAGQKALRISEEKHRTLIEKTLAGIFVHRNDEILFVNSRFAEMLGYSPQFMIGMPMLELIHERDRPKFRDLVYVFNSKSIPDLRYECRFVGDDGRIVWGDVISSMTDYEGVPAVLVHVYDITGRKEAEIKRQELSEITRRQEEQLVHSTRLAELGEMAAAVAHEINQPLTGIRNFANNAIYMIEENAGSIEEIKENLGQISKQVDRASKIINRMRELTRKSEQKLEEVSINHILRESIEFLTPQFRLSGVKVKLDLAKDLPEVLGDQIRLEQVFLNILINARQSMEESRERRLDIKTHVEESDKRYVVVEIADTGKGFSPEEAERLFAPFYSTKRSGHGTGLGLSISLNIIKTHNGAIDAFGGLGKGARFIVKLPVSEKA